MDTPTTSPLESLDIFVEKLIDEKRFEDLTPDLRQHMHDDLKARIYDAINAKVIRELKDEDLPAFEALIDANATPEELQAFMQGKLPDSVNFLTNVLLDFRKMYLGLA